jgi:hypothetical protein
MAADRALGAAFALAVLSLSTGCAGARASITADDARYPVSLSRGVRDAEGDIVTSDREKTVATFRDHATSWAIGYSFIPLSKRKDISGALNDQVKAAGGDAVVNLRTSSAHCASDFFIIFSILPVWPGCSTTEIEGDIIKVAPKTAAVQP